MDRDVPTQAPADFEALRLLVHDSTDMLSRYAPDGTYRFVSPACRELLGYEPEDLVGRSAYELFHPVDLEQIAASHEQVIEDADLSTVRSSRSRAPRVTSPNAS